MAASTVGPSGRYQQQLLRGMRVFGNVMITMSGITPAVSVFAIAPVAFAAQGSGAFLSFVIAGIIGIGMAMCWAELGTAYPIAGGDYSIASRVLGGFVGFLMFVLFLSLVVFIPSALCLGGSLYINVVLPNVSPNVVGAIVMLVTTAVAVLTIRVNAIVTGVFLAVELVALLIVTYLGFTNAHNLQYLLSPHLFSVSGQAIPASVTVVAAGIAIAIFSYNGYNAPVLLAEETAGKRTNIAKAVYYTFVLTIVGELIPITAALIGAPSLAKLTNATTPMTYFLESTGGHTVEVVVGLGIFLAGVNATLAVILWFARLLYSSGRDGAWPGVLSQWMALVHPRFRSPWVATLVVGILGTLLTFFSNIALLVTFTGVVLVLDYGLIAICAIVSRITQKDLPRPYKMPLWPLPALVGIAGTAYTATQQTPRDLAIVAALLAIGAVYYFVYLVPRRNSRWVMLAAPTSHEVEEETTLGTR